MLAQVYIRYTQDFEKGSRDRNIKKETKQVVSLNQLEIAFNNRESASLSS